MLWILFSAGCAAPATLDASTPTPEPAAFVPATAPITTLPPIRVWVSPSVKYQDEVRAGVVGWAFVTQHVRQWTYVDAAEDADVAIYEIGPYGNTCLTPDQIGKVDKLEGVLGCANVGGLWQNLSGAPMPLYLISTEYGRAPKQATMHELGHMLGLVHEDGGLMWGPAPDAVLDSEWECPDPATVARLAEHFDLEGLQACALPERVAQLNEELRKL